jgi:hypothetical protein
MLSECGAGDDVWGRLAGRAASREVTRVLAGAYKAKNWAAVDGLRLSGGGEGSGSYEAAWVVGLARDDDFERGGPRGAGRSIAWRTSCGGRVLAATGRLGAPCGSRPSASWRAARNWLLWVCAARGWGWMRPQPGLTGPRRWAGCACWWRRGGQTRVAVERHMRGPRRAELLEWLRWFSAVGGATARTARQPACAGAFAPQARVALGDAVVRGARRGGDGGRGGLRGFARVVRNWRGGVPLGADKLGGGQRDRDLQARWLGRSRVDVVRRRGASLRRRERRGRGQ